MNKKFFTIDSIIIAILIVLFCIKVLGMTPEIVIFLTVVVYFLVRTAAIDNQ